MVICSFIRIILYDTHYCQWYIINFVKFFILFAILPLLGI